MQIYNTCIILTNVILHSLGVDMEEPLVTKIEQYIIDFVIKLRKEKDLTQEDIGFILGVKQVFIANIENPKNRSKYNVNHINKLADHFGISPQDFLPKKAFPNTQS